jgi:peptidyl-tRNA hydrolase, PTH1 family
VKVICGLGNPGAEYAATRHNVGWWVVEHAQRAWGCSAFRRAGAARYSEGRVNGVDVLLVEPLTYMNRSGVVLGGLLHEPTFSVAEDLLVVVDDMALPVGRVRLRGAGSAGGHNGLKSVEAVLGTRAYARLRIGVDAPLPGGDLAEWVLSPFAEEDERQVRELLPSITAALGVWLTDGVDAAANRING